jgi:homopolymeric O-antigen transport system permease protein
MLSTLAQTWRARELLWALAEREIKARYRRSFLGLLWSLVTPLYQVVLMTIVVKYLWGNPTQNYSFVYLCALIPWTFFQQGVLTSCASVVRARDMVKRVWFPRHIVPLATVASCAFHMGMSLAILIVLQFIIPVSFSLKHLVLVPLLLIELVMVSGISLLASALHSFYQDTEYILTNLLSVFMFLTPVIYPVNWIGGKYAFLREIVLLNPMATVCQGFRSIIIDKQVPDPVNMLIAAAFALLCFIVGWEYFRLRQAQLPEVV